MKDKTQESIAKLRAHLELLEDELKRDISVPIVASFGFIIALVWRDAVKGVIDEFLLRSGLVEQAYLYNILSAIIVTIIVIVIMIAIIRFRDSKRKSRIKKELNSIKQKE